MPHGDGGGSKVSFLLPGGSQALGSIRITWTAVVVKASIPGLVPTAPSPGVSDSADSGWGPRMCISSKFPRAGEAGPGQYFERNCSLEDLGWGEGGGVEVRSGEAGDKQRTWNKRVSNSTGKIPNIPADEKK